MNAPIAEYVDGTVARVNERGLQLEGRDGWLNISKYADPLPVLPEEGAHVRVGLDKAGYVRSVEPAGQAPMLQRDVIAAAGRPAVRESEDGAAYHAGPAPAPPEPEAAAAAGPADRETRITRLACLNTATAILASGSEQALPDDVLELAARLEAWVTR